VAGIHGTLITMPTAKPAESFGTYAARELIAAKAAGKVLTAVPLADFIDVLLDDWMQRTDPADASEPDELTALTITAETIYQAYPRKIGKAAALKAITHALKKTPHPANHPAVILRATKDYAAAVTQWSPAQRYTREGTDTVPHPATWFNRGSYLDDPREWQAKAARTASATSNAPRDYRTI
jgi:hypothetical protein